MVPAKLRASFDLGSKCTTILASTLLFDKSVTLHNLPCVQDITTIATLKFGSKIILSR